jgi:hypothetical protein
MLAKSNYPVYFGDTENCAKKLENLKRILNEISDLGTGRIDVSCVDKPAFIPDSDATPSPTDESPSATPESTAIPTETPQVITYCKAYTNAKHNTCRNSNCKHRKKHQTKRPKKQRSRRPNHKTLAACVANILFDIVIIG